jgi:hypothetical protein
MMYRHIVDVVNTVLHAALEYYNGDGTREVLTDEMYDRYIAYLRTSTQYNELTEWQRYILGDISQTTSLFNVDSKLWELSRESLLKRTHCAVI